MRFGGLSDKLNTDWAVFSETQRTVELLQQFSGLFYYLLCSAMHHTCSCPAALVDTHGVFFHLGMLGCFSSGSVPAVLLRWVSTLVMGIQFSRYIVGNAMEFPIDRSNPQC